MIRARTGTGDLLLVIQVKVIVGEAGGGGDDEMWLESGSSLQVEQGCQKDGVVTSQDREA